MSEAEDMRDLPLDQSKTGSEGVQAPDKALELMQAIILDGGSSPLSSLAISLGLPNSSARRLASLLERRGYVSRVARGRYGVGRGFVELARYATEQAYLCNMARAPLERLARDTGATVHLGVLENEMVTYLLRIGAPDSAIVTDVGLQLEAYCTGIGKVLLAGLSDESAAEYLRAGDFVRLTPDTITDVAELKAELQTIRERGYGMDRAEMFDRVYCLALPISLSGRSVAAVSVSRSGEAPSESRFQRDLKLTRDCVNVIMAFAER